MTRLLLSVALSLCLACFALPSPAEQKAAEEQQKIATALEDMRARLAAIEKLLSDVQ